MDIVEFELLFFDPPRFPKFQVPEMAKKGKVAPEKSE
jgi:hypothetical protein